MRVKLDSIGNFMCAARGCVVAAALLVAPSPAHAQCPESFLVFPFSGSEQYTAAPTFDASGLDGSWARGNHELGNYSLHHSGFLSPTILRASDRFDVTGVPLGTPVNLTMRLRIDGWAFTSGCGGSGCCGMLAATVRAGPDTAQAGFLGQTTNGRADFGGTVELPITLIAGTPRDLEIEMYARRCAGGAHTVDATGFVTFEGTDINAVVVSCKGFGPAAVPVQQRSWGQIKTIYR